MLETALNFYQQDNIHGLQMQEFFRKNKTVTVN